MAASLTGSFSARKYSEILQTLALSDCNIYCTMYTYKHHDDNDEYEDEDEDEEKDFVL